MYRKGIVLEKDQAVNWRWQLAFCKDKMNIRKRYTKIKETKFLALDISTSKRKTGKSLTSSIEVLFAKELFN